MKGMGGGGGGAGEYSLKYYRAICFTRDIRYTLIIQNLPTDQLLFIGGEGGWKRDFWRSHGFQGNRRDQSSLKEYEMRNLEQ